MLHLRVISPPERTGDVRRVLIEEPGATHVTLQEGVALQPPGDLVEADVTREAVDGLLARLADLQVESSGGITLEAIDTTLSDAADAAEEAVPGDPSDAIVWDELVERTGEDSRLSVSFQVFLTIACLLAAIGAVTNSPVTVVGAMVLGPEFGPLAAVAVGLVLRRWDLVRRGALAVGAGFPLAMGITAIAAVVFDATGLLPTNLDHLDEVDFIYQVGPFSLIVALLAGAAGMVALNSAKAAALVGVFISVTTVPAAGFFAVALVEGQFARAGQSALQLLVNLAGIVVAAIVTLLVYRWTSARGRSVA
ncbi:MAG: DUF389 domain-containing protein [Pseudonocardia sp.]|uniref:DUF389 domain-containing protein n=1 Tax=unclassified Pseudonocardia TaxID=2619320 RepID=UPI000869FB52|nr:MULTISPECIES: DUF389 domain-containing protein [unclassified Pseudonocardia]MBN9112332.1 DUF389 domain-containing protein [Pseudonocardia sp.]ODU24256.1 MAG: hypothetical protein ABS80_13060 [Pseudonocardia sp. SCN 72-51]ODV09003.1 MAG: hypothetical protein ABT15_01830 [Pseudonocardia sp. SCN 73-27]